MKQTKTRAKKHTIFRMALVPLIMIMLVQSLLTLGTLVVRKTFTTIQNYSVNMMTRTVENRRINLENAMNQRRSSVYEQNNVLNELLETYLQEHDLSLEEVLASDVRRQELLALFFPRCLDSLQGSQTTGIFVVLTGEDMDEPADCDGFYVRDSNPMVSTANYADLLFERGSRDLARTYNVHRDTCWSAGFRMAGEGNRQADAFYYMPWKAALANPKAEISQLGYWSKPFIMEERENDLHEMISFSVPLRHDGEVYGVLGIEMSESFLHEYFPMTELNADNRSGYLLCLDKGDGHYTALVGKGILYSDIAENGAEFVLEDTKFETLHQVQNVRLGGQKIYAVRCPLKLYDRTASPGDEEWILLGLNTEDNLFGMGRQLYLWVSFAMLFGLVFGVVGIYITVRHLTKPIQDLARCIDGGSDGLKDFQGSNILEIDGLYDVIRDLTNTLSEEKERYRLALESSSDTFFTYDYQKQQLDIVNHPTMEGVWEGMEDGFVDMDRVYYEDRAIATELMQSKDDNIHAEFRYRFADDVEFEWYELYGKVVYDAKGNRYKVVGGMRNIQKKKQLEALQKERKERDGVTGFYSFEFGVSQLERCRSSQPQGTMLYLMLNQLQQMNEENGIVFGDMVLEELARSVKDCCERLYVKKACRILTIRIDGDECAIWLEGQHRKEAEFFIKDFFRSMDGLFAPDVLQVHVTAGLAVATEGDGSTELLRMAKYAQIQAKESAKGRYRFFEGTSAVRRKLPPLEGREVLSNDYGENVNLASLALNLFGKGANLSAQMTLIMRKMGYHYGATDVLTTIVRQDFHSNYLEYQWHLKADEPLSTVNQYTDREWEIFHSWLGVTPVHYFTADESGLTVLQKFLNVRKGQQGVILPMYDSGNYMGNICVIGLDLDHFFRSGEGSRLVEVGNVIQSQINQQQHDLASRAKSDFLSRMSHEIRTPMNGIIGMTAIALQQGQSRERMLDCLNKIRSSSQYLLGLINDILDMSKIESGKMHLEFENFNLQEMLEVTGELIRPQVEAKRIRFEERIELSHHWFLADKMRISQVLINLLGNAVKFTGEEGQIILTVREKGMSGERVAVSFAVQDNGVGISKEDQERVFRSFEQARDASSVSKQQGTGLGLSISSRLIQLMGSTIELESEPGKGSTFRFELCLDPGQEEDQAGEDAGEYSFDNYRVLVVEDNELNSEIARCLLEDHGFRVECAFDGSQAVDRIRDAEPGTYDVVLMDIMMPVMNGLDATRAIRALPREDCKTIPIIAMSANAFDDDLKKSVECGMNGHLSKPVEVDKLYRMLKDILQ